MLLYVIGDSGLLISLSGSKSIKSIKSCFIILEGVLFLNFFKPLLKARTFNSATLSIFKEFLLFMSNFGFFTTFSSFFISILLSWGCSSIKNSIKSCFNILDNVLPLNFFKPLDLANSLSSATFIAFNSKIYLEIDLRGGNGDGDLDLIFDVDGRGGVVDLIFDVEGLRGGVVDLIFDVDGRGGVVDLIFDVDWREGDLDLIFDVEGLREGDLDLILSSSFMDDDNLLTISAQITFRVFARPLG